MAYINGFFLFVFFPFVLSFFLEYGLCMSLYRLILEIGCLEREYPCEPESKTSSASSMVFQFIMLASSPWVQDGARTRGCKKPEDADSEAHRPHPSAVKRRFKPKETPDGRDPMRSPHFALRT